MKHVLQSTTSQNHDLSNHRQNSKGAESHAVCQVPSPFQHASGSLEAAQASPPQVLDQEIQQVIPRLTGVTKASVNGPGQANETMPLWQSNLCQI